MRRYSVCVSKPHISEIHTLYRSNRRTKWVLGRPKTHNAGASQLHVEHPIESLKPLSLLQQNYINQFCKLYSIYNTKNL